LWELLNLTTLSAVATDFILGMGKANDRVTILLDISKVLDPAEAVGF